MAGSIRRVTLSKYAGQVPQVCEHHTQKQRHHTLRHSQRNTHKEATADCSIPKKSNRRKLLKNQNSGFEI